VSVPRSSYLCIAKTPIPLHPGISGEPKNIAAATGVHEMPWDWGYKTLDKDKQSDMLSDTIQVG
jgi:hypothetical protein